MGDCQGSDGCSKPQGISNAEKAEQVGGSDTQQAGLAELLQQAKAALAIVLQILKQIEQTMNPDGAESTTPGLSEGGAMPGATVGGSGVQQAGLSTVDPSGQSATA